MSTTPEPDIYDAAAAARDEAQLAAEHISEAAQHLARCLLSEAVEAHLGRSNTSLDRWVETTLPFLTVDAAALVVAHIRQRAERPSLVETFSAVQTLDGYADFGIPF